MRATAWAGLAVCVANSVLVLGLILGCGGADPINITEPTLEDFEEPSFWDEVTFDEPEREETYTDAGSGGQMFPGGKDAGTDYRCPKKGKAKGCRK